MAALLMSLRILLTLALLSTAYFLLPASRAGEPDGWKLLLQLCVFVAVSVIQLPAIVRSRHPVARAVEALLLVVSLFLFIFARLYLEVSLHDRRTFSEALDQTDSLYFTVSIFATVGFGDIVARGEGARLLVTLQMLLNLVLLGAGIRLLASAARRGVARRRDDASAGPGE